MSRDDDLSRWPRDLSLDDRPGPAAWIARSKADALIRGALDEAGFEHVVVAAPVKKRFATRTLVAAALVACVGIGSASAAVMWFAHAPKQPFVAAPPPPATPRAQEPKRELAHSTPVVAERVEPVQDPARRAPEDGLDEGNRLRAAHRWHKADLAYTRAAEAAPHTQVAYVARVAAAGVRLEHLHDARRALASYRAALKEQPNGALREEIDWGIAETLRALGRRDEERSALALFVREHPISPLVSQAKARLE